MGETGMLTALKSLFPQIENAKLRSLIDDAKTELLLRRNDGSSFASNDAILVTDQDTETDIINLVCEAVWSSPPDMQADTNSTAPKETPIPDTTTHAKDPSIADDDAVLYVAELGEEPAAKDVAKEAAGTLVTRTPTIILDDDEDIIIPAAAFDDGNNNTLQPPTNGNHDQPTTNESTKPALSRSPTLIEDKPNPLTLLTELFPDADPAFLVEQLEAKDVNTQAVIDALIQMNGKYRKRTETSSSTNNKRKRETETEEADVLAKKSKVDPGFRPSVQYFGACMDYLSQVEFPDVYKHVIKESLTEYKQLIPTAVYLRKLAETDKSILKKGKGKGRAAVQVHSNSAEFNDDLSVWKAIRGGDIEIPIIDLDPIAGPSEEEMECGCCYCDYPMSKMTFCQDGHLFCLECARKAAETTMGYRKTEMKCLDSSGCKYSFSRHEMERFLGPKGMEGYNRLCQEESLRQAGMSDLATCPFCDYAVIMTTRPEEDKLFHCKSPDCGTISCRLCQRVNHIPKSCEEAAKDNKLDIRHLIEEKMTEALVRQCNKCKSKFVKLDGCNKMTCPQCHSLMCYVCKKSIKGYDHFNNGGPNPKNMCPLYDDTEKRNEQDVKTALERALSDVKKTADADINADEFKSELLKNHKGKKKTANQQYPHPFGFGYYNPQPADNNYDDDNDDEEEHDEDEDYDDD